MRGIQPYSINSIHESLVYKNMYTLQGEKDDIAYKAQPTAEDFLHTARRMVELSQDPSKTSEERLKLIGCLYEYLRRIREKVFAGGGNDQFNELLAKALLLIVNKPLSAENIAAITHEITTKSDWYQFFTYNHVHYMIHRQGVSYVPGMDNDIAGWIAVNGTWYKFANLEKRATEEGFGFYHQGNLLFTTDLKLKLKDYFWAGERGIIQGNPIETKGLGDFFQRPASGKHWLSVYSVAKNDTDIRFGSSHCYLSIENSDGRLSYAGQYGLNSNINFFSAITPFGKKGVGIETPDRYSQVPIGQHVVKEVRIEITSDQYKILKESIERDKKYGDEGSLIAGNCASFVRKKLELIGLKAKVSISASEFFMRLALQPLPRALNKKIVQLANNLPSIVKKVAHFCPLIYIPMLAISLATRLLSGVRADFSIIDAFIRPWNVSVDHPLAFFESMDKLQSEVNKFRFYNAKSVSNSRVGNIVKEIYGNLGFRENEEANLKIKTQKHVTQHTVKSLPSLIVKALYDAIGNKINNLLSKHTVIDQNTMILYLNGLMTQKLITPYEFHSLKQAISNPQMLRQELRVIGENLFQKKSIDRRSFIHFNELLSQRNTNEALCYLFSVHLFMQLNSENYKNILKEIVSVEMQGMIQDGLEYYHNNYTFSSDHVIKIESLVSRVKCYEWASTVQDPVVREELKKAIKSKNEQDFIDATVNYFERLSQVDGTSITQKKVLEELGKTVQSHHAQNAFVGFAHVMQVQAMIQDMENDLDRLHMTIRRYHKELKEDDIRDLKALHQNMGVFLANEVAFSGSHTWISAHLGKVRGIWQDIENYLVGISKENRIIPIVGEKDTWPDVGFREISALSQPSSVGESKPAQVQKKKLFITYCTYGSGHKSTAEAYAKSLGDTYRISTCDLPDEVFIQKDPLFQLLGKHNSITTLYNTLVAGNYWSVLGLIRKMGEKPSEESEHEEKKDMIRRKVLQEQPDMIIATYERHSKELLEVAEELGIPFLQVSTDMISKFDGIDQREHAYDHFKVALPYGIQEAFDAYGDRIKKSQVAVTGHLIRPEFYNELSEAEVRQEFNIAQDEKVIVCMNGGCGGNVPWPKLLASAETGAFGKCKVFVVCGKNEAFLEEVKSYKPKDPNIQIVPLGWTDATKLNKLASVVDVLITKPGGASIAEALRKKAYMLLDVRNGKDLPWELDTAGPLVNYEQAIQLANAKDFYSEFKRALTLSAQERKEFPGMVANPHEEVRTLVADMIKRAEADGNLMHRRKHAVDNDAIYGKMDIEPCKNETFDQNLAELLKYNESLFPKDVVPSLERALWKASKEKCFIRYNPVRNVFETSKTFEKDPVVYASLLLKRLSREEGGLPLETFKHLSEVVLRQSKEPKEKLETLLKALADLDRERLAKMVKSKKVALPQTIEEAEKLYLFPDIKRQLNDWVNLQTSRARFKGLQESCFTDKNEALKAFICYPEEYDFVQKLYLHRKLSAYNHTFEIVNGHISVMLEGKMTQVSELMSHFNYVNDRIINVKDHREFTYTYDKGLCPIDDTNNPYDWKDQIPVFKKKVRKNGDYRLEVLTTIGKKANHGWVRLKDPEGNIYSVGRLWDRDYQLETYKRLKTIPGYVRAGDLHEFTGEEANWKRTKIVLSKEHFEAAKNRIIDIQNNEKSYNLINRNCLSFVENVFQTIGIQHRVGESPFYLFTLPPKARKVMLRNKLVQKVCKIVVYPLTLLKNVLFAAFGMFEKRDIANGESGGFNEAVDLFTAEKSLVDHHTQLRLIQEILEEDHGDKLRGNKIYWSELAKG